jgi:hypothetical protein
MTDSKFNSDVNTGLPNLPLNIKDQELFEQLKLIYNAIQILQIAHSQLREEFNAYVLAHP